MFFIANHSYFEIYLVLICEKKLSFRFHNNILIDYTLAEKYKIKLEQIVKTDVIYFFFFINKNDLLHMVI